MGHLGNRCYWFVPAAGNASAPIRAVIRHGIWEFAKGAGLAAIIDSLLSMFHGEIEVFLLKLESWISQLQGYLKDTINQLGTSLAQFIESPVDWAEQVGLVEKNCRWYNEIHNEAKKLPFRGMEALLSCMGESTRKNFQNGVIDYAHISGASVVEAIAKLWPLIIAITDAVRRKMKNNRAPKSAHVANTGNASEPVKLTQQHGDSHPTPKEPAKETPKDKPGCSTCPKVEAGHRPKPRTENPIHLVMGDENLWQTDFVVPGLIDLEWTRFYRSSCDMLDDSELGARWSTPYHLRFEQSDEQLFFVDDENRCVPLASLAVGESRYEPAEHVTLSRPTEHEIVLETLYNDRQRYVRTPQGVRCSGWSRPANKTVMRSTLSTAPLSVR